jgi:hypothetical protein
MLPSSGTTLRDDIKIAISPYAANLETQFMATKIMPVFKSISKGGQFPRMKMTNITKKVGTGRRAPNGTYDQTESEFEMLDFECKEFGFEERVGDDVQRQVASYFDAEAAVARTQLFRLRRAQEIRTAGVVFNASTFAGYTGGVTTEWNKAAATPYSDIQDILPTLKKNIGGVFIGEIVLGCSEKVFRNICKTTEIKNMRKGGTGSVVNQMPPTAAELAALLDINAVEYSIAQDGTADVWDDEYALLFIRNQSENLEESVQFGRTMLWVEDSPDNAFVETYYSDERRGNIVRVRHQVTEKIFNVNAGYLLSNITE